MGNDERVIIYLLLEPFHGFVSCNAMFSANTRRASTAFAHAESGTAQHDVEIHAVDTDGRIVFQAQVDVLLNSEPEVAVIAEVVLTQLVFLDLERNKKASSLMPISLLVSFLPESQILPCAHT